MPKKLDDLIIGLQLQAKAFEEGLNSVKKQLNKHSTEVRNTGRRYDELAIAAGVAFWKITDAIKGGIDTFNEYRASAVGLQSIVEGTGNSFAKAQAFIEAYTKDGLVPAADAATALKKSSQSWLHSDSGRGCYEAIEGLCCIRPAGNIEPWRCSQKCD